MLTGLPVSMLSDIRNVWSEGEKPVTDFDKLLIAVGIFAVGLVLGRVYHSRRRRYNSDSASHYNKLDLERRIE